MSAPRKLAFQPGGRCRCRYRCHGVHMGWVQRQTLSGRPGGSKAGGSPTLGVCCRHRSVSHRAASASPSAFKRRRLSSRGQRCAPSNPRSEARPEQSSSRAQRPVLRKRAGFYLGAMNGYIWALWLCCEPGHSGHAAPLRSRWPPPCGRHHRPCEGPVACNKSRAVSGER